MDLQTSASLNSTLRLKQVLRTTGLSKESWINDRIPLRPGSPKGTAEHATKPEYAITRNGRSRRLGTQQSGERVSSALWMNGLSPGSAELHLMDTKIYCDKTTDSFWLKLLPEDPTRGR